MFFVVMNMKFKNTDWKSTLNKIIHSEMVFYIRITGLYMIGKTNKYLKIHHTNK